MVLYAPISKSTFVSLFKVSLNKNKYTSVNLYFQDESRYGLMTHLGKYLTASGVKPIVEYQHIL